ncbi:MAG: neutral/alkaline non-lysosomal ceramidase N-terminal domain-containing protein [Verrucomicrobiae bacterium]|nr:neutral/alkaline non-lysosomal ceramidase N-terminal domain-containing protein [Verrucomicrobiae bacterium]
MTDRIAGSLIVATAIWISGCATTGLGAARSGFEAGAAAVKITPSKLLWQNGYGSRKHPAEGTAMDLWARAIALRDRNGRRSVIVCIETLGVPPTMNNSIRRKARAKFGLRDAELMLAATHTHAAPALPERPSLEVFLDPDAEQTQLINEHAAWLEDRVIEVIGKALSDCGPARLAFGHSRATFARNRRLITPAGVKMTDNPDGAVDHDLLVLIARRPDGGVKAIVYGYACHCTTIGGDYYLYHGDYAGVASEELEKRYPGAVPVFVTGCGADANPSPRGRVEMTVPHGQELAQAVARVVDDKTAREITAAPRQTYQRIELAFEKPPTREQWEKLTTNKTVFVARHAKLHLKLLDRNRVPRTLSYPIQTWQFGRELTMVALAGEVVVDYTLRLKKEYGAETMWVIGFANEVPCYIPSKRVLEEGGYEAGWRPERGRTIADSSMVYYGWPAPLATDTEERIFRVLHRVLVK